MCILVIYIDIDGYVKQTTITIIRNYTELLQSYCLLQKFSLHVVRAYYENKVCDGERRGEVRGGSLDMVGEIGGVGGRGGR